MEEKQLDSRRHSCAHLLAAAVKSLYPGANNAIGPSIENGFYQDFDMGEYKISETDLPKIEEKMREILKNWGPFVVKEVTVEQAKKDFANNPYKLELIEEFSTQGKTITENDPGNFLDLCKGGHSDNPQEEMKHFKLLSVAGAYWRGDEKNKMLTRVYGTCFPTKAELDAHLLQLEEAKKRDHKKLGKELDLFTFSDLVGPGLPLWTPNGTIVRNLLDEFVWSLRQKRNYVRVEIPHITKQELYEISGHWDKFKNELFRITTREGHEFAMKPMNCPHHTQIYARRQWSYRELPQRYASTTMCYRDEQSGELAGLFRVRAFTQDDAHCFARLSQAKQEFLDIWDIIHEFYGAFGFKLRVRVSLRDPASPEKYLGKPEQWTEAEKMLREVATDKKAETFEGMGEAAFYGPKLDFMAKDSIGREYQVATIQLDFNQPERFDLTVVNENGDRERIVMIHAAIMGSIERFLGILIEHVAGVFPVWLSPVQILFAPVGEKHADGASNLAGEFKNAGVRVEMDSADETLGNKVRKAVGRKIPYIVVVGDKELEGGDLMIRVRGEEKPVKLPKVEFMAKVLGEIKERK